MRPVVSWALALSCLAPFCLGAGALTARAAGFAIDPDPNSMTLGEILDRERLANAPRPALRPAALAPASAEPVVPLGAVTVLAPRTRGPVRQIYPIPPQRPE